MSALPNHHVSADTLFAYASGALGRSASVMVASHLTLCPSCRHALAAAEAVGGAVLETMSSEARLNCTADQLLARSDTSASSNTAPRANTSTDAVNDNLPNATYPRPIRDLIKARAKPLSWRWMGPGVRYAYLADDDAGYRIGLMRIAAGTKLPRHGHTGEEFTMVLAGGYNDDIGQFVRGDVEWADDQMVHQPHADQDGECLCLVVTKGTLKAKGFLAPLLQPLMAI